MFTTWSVSFQLTVWSRCFHSQCPSAECVHKIRNHLKHAVWGQKRQKFSPFVHSQLTQIAHNRLEKGTNKIDWKFNVFLGFTLNFKDGFCATALIGQYPALMNRCFRPERLVQIFLEYTFVTANQTPFNRIKASALSHELFSTIWEKNVALMNLLCLEK